MSLTRSSKRSEQALALALLALLASCRAATVAPTYPTTDRWADERRQPDGVALDPLAAALAPATIASAPAPAALALRPPLPVDEAFVTLRAWAEALGHEDLAALTPLVTERSTWVTLPSRGSVPLLAHLRERMRRLDYLQFAGQPLVDESDAEVYTHAELAGALPGRPSRPPEMAPADLLLRLRVLTPRVGADRLFADTLLVVLRPDAGHYRIHSLQEEFQLP